MSNLLRYTQKLFASTPGLNQIGKFGSLAAAQPAPAANPGEAMSLSNWLTGWFGAVIGGNSPAIEDLNAYCYAMSHQVGYLMQKGVPEWDAGTDYYVGCLVNSGGVLYVSKTNNNLNKPLTDATQWRKLRIGEEAGTGKDFWGSILPDGYVWANGTTIGNSNSNASQRANGDTFDLYSIFWNDYSDAALPILTAAGNPSTRGNSALDDFTAGKRLTVIDARDRVRVGLGTMGQTSAAGRVTAAGGGFNTTALGNVGGSQSVQLTVDQMPSHTHTQQPHNHQEGGQNNGQNRGGTMATSDGGGYALTSDYTGNTTALNNNTGGDQAHPNVQPSIACNYIIKL